MPEPDRLPEEGAGRRVARNAIARTIGEVVAKGASVAFFVVMARKLGASSFGDFMFALSLTSIVVLASGFGTEDLLAREVARDRSRVHDYLSNVVAVKGPTSFALVLASAGVLALLDYPQQVVVVVVLVGCGVAFENLGKAWASVFQAFERMEFVAVALILQRTLTAVAGSALLLAGAGLVVAAAVFLLGAVAGCLAGLFTLRRFVVRPERRVDRRRFWPLIKAGIPIGLITVLFQLLLKVDQTLLGFLAEGKDNRQVGFYAAAMRLVEATMFIPWSFSAAMLPWLAKQEDGRGGQVARGWELGLKVMAVILVPIGLGFALLAEPLIDLLYGRGFDASVVPLRFLGITTVLIGFNNLAATLMVARDRPGDFNRLLALVAVLNISVNIALIPSYGATGAAFAAVLSSAVLAVLSLWRVTQFTGPVSLLRVFAGPVVAGAAMVAAIVGPGLPLVPAAVLGGLAYLGALGGVERLLHPADFERAMATLRRRSRPVGV